MSESNRYGGAHLLIAFLAGAAAGAVAAYLTAPRSGRELRQDLREWAGDVREKATRVPHAVRAAYSRASEAAKTAFVEALHEAEKSEKAG